MSKTYRSIKEARAARTSSVAMQAPAAMTLLRGAVWIFIVFFAVSFVTNLIRNDRIPLPEPVRAFFQPSAPSPAEQSRTREALQNESEPDATRTLTWVRDLDIDANAMLAEYYARYGIGKAEREDDGTWRYLLPNGSVAVLPNNWDVRAPDDQTRVLNAVYGYTYELSDVYTWWLW